MAFSYKTVHLSEDPCYTLDRSGLIENPYIPAIRTRFVQPGKIEIDANERAVIGKRNAAFSFAPSSILSLTICTSTLPYFQPLFHKPETASVIISSSRLSESAPCSGCWVSCPSLFSAPFSGSIFHLLLHKEILFFLLPIAGAFLTICFDQTLAVDSVPPRAAFISSLPPLSIKQIFSKSYRAGYPF